MVPQNCETRPCSIYFGKWKSIKLMQTLNIIFLCERRGKRGQGVYEQQRWMIFSFPETSSVMRDTFAPTAQVSRRDPDIISQMRTWRRIQVDCLPKFQLKNLEDKEKTTSQITQTTFLILTVESPPPDTRIPCGESGVQMKARQETNLYAIKLNEHLPLIMEIKIYIFSDKKMDI